jgi:outer membrane lipoprotein-sorting protein
LASLLVVLLSGCAQREDIPKYPPLDLPSSLATIRQRSAQVQNVSGEGAITLTDAKGQSVRLDAAFVLAPPDRARVRAWKFGQAVLDLTILPDGTWMYLPRGQDGHAEQLRAGAASAGRAVRQWLSLLSGQLDASQSSARVSGSHLLVTQPASDGMTLTATIDRDTLTVRRCALTDASGHERFSLTLDKYRVIGPTVWPSRIDADSDTGKISIEMRDVELNDAPPTAFKPPARAVEVK